ncbi:MAG: DUF3365 domain-containing protein [Acidobacteria bacterium]|nr:DUF3365 domain-containing protein [Acidobacteriota bacterium]
MRAAAKLAILSVLAASGFSQEPTPRQRAAEAVRDLAAVLQQLLGEEMKRGGVEGAVKSCSETAQVVTEEFAKERELDLRRVSLKYRNQKDQPDDYEAARLKEWEAQIKLGKPPAEHTQTVTENGRRYIRYMKPILVQGVCLACHGPREKLAPEVLEVLDARYPRDKATGYRAGDLRGAFSAIAEVKP